MAHIPYYGEEDEVKQPKTNAFLQGLKSFFSKIFENIAKSRQRQANVYIAELLHRNEYRNSSFMSVLRAVELNDYSEIKGTK